MGGGVTIKETIKTEAPPRVLTAADYPFRVTLPACPSINALFGQAPGRKRYPSQAYKAWQEEAAWLLKQQHPPRYLDKVWLALIYPDAGRFDIDNRIKPYPDLLKKLGVIVDDSRRYLRGVHLAWADISGVLLEVRPFSFSQTRSA